MTGWERVLAFGRRPGPWALALARANQEVHAVDADPEALAAARVELDASGITNAHLSHAPSSELPFPDGYFDAVLIHNRLLLPARSVDELMRVVRPEGLVRLARERLEAFDWRRAPRRILSVLRRAQRERRLPRPLHELALVRASARPRSPDPRVAAWVDEIVARPQAINDPYHRLAPGVTVVDPTTYSVSKLAAARARLSGLDLDTCLDQLAQRLTEPATSDPERVEAVIRFLQEALFHNPLEQPPLELHPVELLELREGRCGHVARVAAALLLRAGFPARLRQLRAHIIAEAFLEGSWRIVDPDAFKNGVIPRDEGGRLLRVADLETGPDRIDRYPTTGWWIRPGSRYARNAEGQVVSGYIDVLEPHERGYVSRQFAPWLAPAAPPAVPRALLHDQVEGAPRRVRLAWTPGPGPAPVRYRVRVGTTSRGWSRDSAEYSLLLNRTGAEVTEQETPAPQLVIQVEQAGTYFWSVTAIDHRGMADPDIHYWESEEASFVLGEPPQALGERT